MKKILITGVAGFIGFHLVRKLATMPETELVGIDIINDYYDVNLKYNRLSQCGIAKNDILPGKYVQSSIHSNYRFKQIDIADTKEIDQLFQENDFDIVINLAAQAGVRYSLLHPESYIHSNIVGFYNILNNCKLHNIKHLLYASSSSVYGMSEETPFTEDIRVDYPLNLYAASKKSNELMAHSYSHLFQLPTTGLRFFTVYGPWGRPDMALMLFTDAIYKGEPIQLFNGGKMLRDFTYIDDIINSIKLLMENVPDEKEEHPFYRIVNIGNSNPVQLIDFVNTLEEIIDIKTEKINLPMQAGDVKQTYADTSQLQQLIGFQPNTPIKEGIRSFINWYKEYYQS